VESKSTEVVHFKLIEVPYCRPRVLHTVADKAKLLFSQLKLTKEANLDQNEFEILKTRHSDSPS
jgi:hypothetical protein